MYWNLIYIFNVYVIINCRLFLSLTYTLDKIQLVSESLTKCGINQFLELLLPVYKNHVLIPKKVRFLGFR